MAESGHHPIGFVRHKVLELDAVTQGTVQQVQGDPPFGTVDYIIGDAGFPAARAVFVPRSLGQIQVAINQGVLSSQTGRLDDAIATLKQVLAEAAGGYLGVKHECGCHYNLAVAYERKGLDAQAAIEFNAVLDTWPDSEYARRAEAALARRRKGVTRNE